MPLYRSDIAVAATIYVRAANYAEAAIKISEAHGCALEVEDTGMSDIAISGASFDSLPYDVSLSPAMTVCGPLGDIEEVE